MPAYMIVTCVVHDRAAFLDGYGRAAAALVERFGGRYRLHAGGGIGLEGMEDGTSAVVSEWPDKAAALRFWNSPEYAEARQLREGLADCRVLLVEASTMGDPA